MSELSAAVGVGQLKHLQEIIDMRINAGKSLCKLITTHNDFIAQQTVQHGTHSFYTAGIRYVGKLKWRDIYNEVLKQGGDGFYGCVLNPYLEPVFRGKQTTSQLWNKGLCLTAEQFQPQVMAIKTNFRNQLDLDRNLAAWKKVITKL